MVHNRGGGIAGSSVFRGNYVEGVDRTDKRKFVFDINKIPFSIIALYVLLFFPRVVSGKCNRLCGIFLICDQLGSVAVDGQVFQYSEMLTSLWPV